MTSQEFRRYRAAQRARNRLADRALAAVACLAIGAFAALAFAGAPTPTPPAPTCITDSECAAMFGGDGGPEPAR